MRLRSLPVLAVATLLLAVRPVTSWATSEICDNEVDDDFDSLVDCDDPNCAGGIACGGGEDCLNGLDDDTDGNTDCADSDCAAHWSCVPENCFNEVDDNGDGLADCDDWYWCGSEPGCAPTESDCTDEADNDEDGYTDCDDGDCAFHLACSGGQGGETACTDEADNDEDGFTDCDDSDCEFHFACSGGGGTETACFDDADNDADGFTDCDDQDCAFHTGCSGENDCANSEDDDEDGLIDCDDADCSDDQACAGIEHCDNGVDDDDDTLVDCDDADCETSNACQDEICDNGLDDDADDFFDCSDPDCYEHQSCLFEICDNDVDDDGDEMVDCDDPDCALTKGVACLPEDCGNGFDEDGDDLIDCEDPDCEGSVRCAPEICDNGVDDNQDEAIDCSDEDCFVECNPEICANGEDDDLDESTDCEDEDCTEAPQCQPETCDNGTDDDLDEWTDCEDEECFSDPSCNVEICDNLEDDDGDELVDCDDNECAETIECAFEICDNGVDDDFDETTDCDDADCSEAQACRPEICDNAIDDDLDEATDCDDEECVATPGCNPEICINGADDDSDGMTDCDDVDCVDAMPCQPEDCANGLDDDSDESTDCDDDECFDAIECNPEICGNSEDDDDDSLVDCEDPDCSEVPGCFEAECDDLADDDEDGLVDCADPDCAEGPWCVDGDGDGIVDALDACAGVPDDQTDSDGDGAGDSCDNCPGLENPSQSDENGDGHGDACEPSNRRPVIGEIRLGPDPTAGAIMVDVVVRAHDADGSVAALELFVDVEGEPGTGMAHAVAPPASEICERAHVDVSGLPPGDHLIHVRAIDAEGLASSLTTVPLTVTTGVMPVVIAPGYHVLAPGAHPEQVALWRSRISTQLGRPAFVSPLDAWGSPHENAEVLAATVDAARSATGSARVDVLAYDAGGFALREYLDRGGEDLVRRAVFVGTPHLGSDLLDTLAFALTEQAGAGDGAAAARLEADRAMEHLTTAGALAFDATHRDPAGIEGVQMIQIGGLRPPGNGDDILPLVSATGLSGPNVETMAWEEIEEERPLHSRLLDSQAFFDDFVRPALGTASGGVQCDGIVLGALGDLASPASTALTLPMVDSVLAVGGKFQTQVTVGDAETASFTQYSIGGTVDLTATGPTGGKFNAGTDQLAGNATLTETTGGDGLDSAEWTFTDPTEGVWTFDVETSGTTFGKFVEISALEATLRVAPLSATPGQPVVARMSLGPAGVGVTEVTARFLAPDLQDVTVILRDNGVAPDATASDRTFTGALSMPSVTLRPDARGRWTVAARARGTLQTSPFDRTITGWFDLTAGEIRTTGAFDEAPSDPLGGGLFGSLAIDVGIELKEAGDFLVAGELTGPSGKLVGQATTLIHSDAATSGEVKLEFPGQDLSADGLSGKFQLSQLILANVGEDPVIVSELEDVYETAALDVGQFVVDGTPQIAFLRPTSTSPITNTTFALTWEDSDPDSAAVISLFLDTNASGLDGTPVAGAQLIQENDETDTFLLNVSGLAEGQYFPYARITDGAETITAYASAPVRVGLDSDGDGMLDSYESAHGLNPMSFDSHGDLDGDGLTNGQEAAVGTRPNQADTDGFGEEDGRELRYGRNPAGRVNDDVVLPVGAVLGDLVPVNLPDGRVTVGDAVKLLRLAVELDNPTPQQMLRADLAPAIPLEGSSPPTSFRIGNGDIDVADVVLILRTAVGLTTIVEP